MQLRHGRRFVGQPLTALSWADHVDTPESADDYQEIIIEELEAAVGA